MPHEDGRFPVVRFGAFSFDTDSCELYKGETRLKVPDQSLEILKALVERPGLLVTRDDLRRRLWPPDTFVDFESGLNAAVRRLREALHDSADEPRFIETLPRRGYRFIAEVAGSPVVAPVPALATDAPESTPGRSGSEGVGPAPTSPSRDVPHAPVWSTASEPTGSPVRTSWPIRRVGGAWTAALAALGLSVIAIALWAARREGAPARTALTSPRPMPVTSLVGLEIHPAVSPGGNQFAFAWEGDSGNNLDIYVRSIGGGPTLRLTTDAAPDHSPVWSPDGQRIAFVRLVGGRRRILAIPALGGPEQRVTEGGPESLQTALGGASNGLAWTPDGKGLLFGDRDPIAPASTIWVFSLETGHRQQLSSPPRHFSDSHPVVSPDGRYLGFVRRNAAYWGGNVFVQEMDGLRPVGEAVQLTFDDTTLALDWMPDSRRILYDSGHGRGGLWRVAATGGKPEPLLTNVRARRPSVSRDGARVLFQNTTIDTNIWRIPGPHAASGGTPPGEAVRIIASTFGDTSPQFSPDGTRIAFVSHRSGNREVWTAKSDGSQQLQLTSSERSFSGSPRWSPDGQSVALDTIRDGTWQIGMIGADGGPVRIVTEPPSNNVRPAWSGDGHWIYFGSDRTGDWQIWKVPSAGGVPIQVTRKGGREALESSDGRVLYYAKMSGVPGIWQVPVAGGTETPVLPRGREMTWTVVDRGIALLETQATPRATIELFELPTRRLVPIATLPPGLRLDISNPSFAVSRDGRWILFVQYDHWSSDIEMVGISH